MLNANNVESGGGKKMFSEPFSPGGYPARLVQVIDLGLQPQEDFKTKEAKAPRNVIRSTYETLDEFMKDEDGNEIEDKPRWISEEFALHSLDSDLATSTKRYNALDPTGEAGGDWSQLLGKACIVNIVNNPGKGKHKGKVFDKIDSTAPMRDKEAKKAPDLVNEPKVFDTSAPDVEIFLSLPDFVQDKIRGSLNFEGGPLEEALSTYKKDKGAEAPEEDQQVSDGPESESDEDW